MQFARSFVVALGCVALAALGCSSGSAKVEGVVPVAGTVNQGGKPLAGATVTFSPVNMQDQASGKARAASATTDDGGRFKLTTLQPGDGALPGEYQVMVSKTETVGKQYTPEEANEYYAKNMKPAPAPERKELVNPKYKSVATTTLKASVKKGEKNDFPFDVD